MDKTERIKVMITFLRKAGFGDVVDEVKDQQAEIDELKKENSDLHVKYEAMSEVNTELVDMLGRAKKFMYLVRVNPREFDLWHDIEALIAKHGSK